MTPGEEKTYVLGGESMALQVLLSIRRDLPPEARNEANAIAQLTEARLSLFSLFEHLDIMDQWDSGLHLADLVKRLSRHLNQ